jgi:myo-inositol 2-dehydrogenase / D-chiro-inositol 1-dehydrogenase
MSNSEDGAVRRVGLAVIGCGVIGSTRARLARGNSRIRHLEVCDVVADKAQSLAASCQADAWDTNFERVIERPEVDAVVVSTSEGDHCGPVQAAIDSGKPVLVEKPITLTLEEVDQLLTAADRRGVDVFTGFTQRFRRRYATAIDHVLSGRLGALSTVTGKIYVTSAVAEAVMQRAPTTSPSLNTLTYLADLLLWSLAGAEPQRVSAVGGKGHFWERYGVFDSTWALITFEGGCVANIGTSWEPSERHPAVVSTMALELFGRKGYLAIDDSHHDVMLVSSDPLPSPYNPEVASHVALLGTAMPGDWAFGQLFGPMKMETDAFIDFVAGHGRNPVLASGKQGREVLSLTLAIDEAARSGETVVFDAARRVGEPRRA